MGFNPSFGGGNQLEIAQQYGAFEDFGIDDLEAWLEDTDMCSDFGELTREPCRESGEDTWLCGDIKVSANGDSEGSTRSNEFLRVGFDSATDVVDITLRISE